MNWFKKHLNWTYVLTWLFYFFICLILGFAVGFFAPETPDSSLDVMLDILMFAILLPISVLVIRAKGRSLWWILLVGWFSPLWLSSKSKPASDTMDENIIVTSDKTLR